MGRSDRAASIEDDGMGNAAGRIAQAGNEARHLFSPQNERVIDTEVPRELAHFVGRVVNRDAYEPDAVALEQSVLGVRENAGCASDADLSCLLIRVRRRSSASKIVSN